VFSKDTYPDSTVSETRHFFTDTNNDTPGIPTPFNFTTGDELGPDDSLTWTRNDADPGDTLEYQILIDDDNIFGSPAIDTAITLSTMVAIQDFNGYGNLVDDVRYYVAISAEDPHGANSGFNASTYFFFNGINDAPSQPFNLGPSNGTDVNALNYLRWEITDADSVGNTPDTHTYTVQVSSNSSFSPVFSNNTGLTADSVQIGSLQNYALFGDLTTYYWRVYATDNHGLSGDTSAVMNVRVIKSNQSPSAVTLSQPPDDASVSLNPTFDWSDASDPDGDSLFYTIQLDDSNDFTNLLHEFVDIIPSNYTLPVADSLFGNQTYYWRIYTRDENDNASISVDTFLFTTPNHAPSPFSLTSPDRGTMITYPDTLEWPDVTDVDPSDSALSYVIEFDNDSTFGSPALVVSGLTESTWELSLPNSLGGNDTYYWRVKAIDSYPDTTVSSNILSLVTPNNAPDAFNLSSPVNGSETRPLPLLDWPGVTDPDTTDALLAYRVEVADNSSFIDPVINKSTGTTSSYQVLSSDSLLDNKQYFWRVWAIDSYPDSTLCTSAFTFYNDAGNNIPELSLPLSPLPNSEVSLTDTLYWTRNDDDPGDTLAYNVRLSDDRNFTVIRASKTDWVGTQIAIDQLDGAGELLDDAIYYWQVEAHDPEGASSGYTAGTDSVYFNRENDAPNEPVILAPPNNAIQSFTDYLYWSASDNDSLGLTPDSLVYNVIIDNNEDFSSPISVTYNIPVDSIRINALTNSDIMADNQQYFWRVFATDNHGANGDTSSVSVSFWYNTINSSPSNPTITAPAIGGTLEPTDSLTWNAATDPDPFDSVTHVVEISSSSDFSDIISTDSIKASALQCNKLRNYVSFKDGHRYYWRLFGFDNLEKVSDTIGGQDQTFIFESTPPTVPTALSPRDERAYFPTEPVLWRASADTDAGTDDSLVYVLQVSLQSSFQNIQISDTLSDTAGVLQDFDGFDGMVDNTTYFWRVKSLDNHNASSNWSAVSSFILDKSNNEPEVPEIIAPIDSQIVGRDSVFMWRAATDPDPGNTVTYTIIAFSDSEQVDTVLRTSHITDTAITLDSLLASNAISKIDTSVFPETDTAGFRDNRFYYWSIAAVDNRNAESFFSDPGLLYCNTVNDTPGVPSGLQPAFGALIYPTELLRWNAEVTEEFGDTVRYVIQISSDTTSDSTNNIVAGDTITSSQQVRVNNIAGWGNLQNETSYFWRVKAIDRFAAGKGYSSWAFVQYSFSNYPPIAPENPYPADSTISMAPTDTMRWSQTPDQDDDSIYFEIYLSDSEFDTTIDSTSIEIYSLGIPDTFLAINTIKNGYPNFQHNTTYYYRLRARDEHFFYSSWTDMFSFRYSSTSPLPIDSLFPPEGTEITPDDLISWQPAEDVDAGPGDSLKYIVFIDDNADFTSLNSVDTVSDTFLVLRNAQGLNSLEDDMSYNWKVKAIDPHGTESDFSASTIFDFNRTNSPPFKPDSLRPLTVASLRPGLSLRWFADDPEANDTLTYRIEICKDTLFTTLLLLKNNWPDQFIQLNEFTNYRQKLQHDSTYYWRLRSRDSEGNLSVYSDTGAFTYDEKDDLASIPELQEPDIGDYVIASSEIVWNNSIDPEDSVISYIVEVSSDSGFLVDSILSYSDTIRQNSDSITTVNFDSLVGLDNLVENRFYFLRVRPLSLVDTAWIPGFSTPPQKIWYGDTLISGDPGITAMNVVIPQKANGLTNVALSRDGRLSILFPDSAVADTVAVRITSLPQSGTLDTLSSPTRDSLDPAVVTMVSRAENANKFALGDEFLHYVKETAYWIELVNVANPDDTVNLNGTVVMQIGYHDLDSNGRADGDERIPVEDLRIFRLNEDLQRWELAQTVLDTSVDSASSNLSKTNGDLTVLPGLSHRLLTKTNHFSVYSILAYKKITDAFDAFKVFPSPLVLSDGKKANIVYRIAGPTEVNIRIYSAHGGLVWKKEISPDDDLGRPLVSDESGEQKVVLWDGRNLAGRLVANGTYVVKILAKPQGSKTVTLKQYIGVVK